MHPLLIALALAAAPRAAVVVHTTGFSDDDTRKIRDKAQAEVKAQGVELWSLAAALEVKPECLEDRACAKDLLRAADAAFLVNIDVLRAGGQASLSATLIDSEGRVSAENQGVQKVEAVLGEGPLLAPELLAPLKAAKNAPPVTATPDPQPVDSPKDPPAPTTDPPAPLTPEDPAAEPAPEELSPLALGGVAALAVGSLATLAGGAVVAAQFGVINDPASLRAEKEQAALVLIPAMGAVALVGVATAATGGVLLWLGLQEG